MRHKGLCGIHLYTNSSLLLLPVPQFTLALLSYPVRGVWSLSNSTGYQQS